MRNNHAISIALVLALFVSQLASSIHVVSHLQPAENQLIHALVHAAHSADDHTPCDDVSQPPRVESDCSVYHAFAGVAGIVPVDGISIPLKPGHALTARKPQFSFVTNSRDAEPIRGPPNYS